MRGSIAIYFTQPSMFHTLSRVFSKCRRCRHFSFHPFLCVRLGQSLREGPHILPSGLFFINTNYCVESVFCAYATFINEARGPWETKLKVSVLCLSSG